MSEPKELGRRAEELAADYLRRQGWRVLSRNVFYRSGELDIVALDPAENEMVVVEVRYRTCGDVQSPAESVGPKKLRALRSAGEIHMDRIDWSGPWRIDLIGVTASFGEPSERWHVEHIVRIL